MHASLEPLRRVLVTTDIGGSDPDDIQSFIHLLQHSNLFDLRGVVVGEPRGKVKTARMVARGYREDYREFAMEGKGFIHPDALDAIIVDGARASERWQPNPGAAHIINEARQTPDDQLLILLSWGAATDIATAVFLEPGIKSRVIVYAIGGWNRDQDRNSYDFLLAQKDLRFIDCRTSFRGMYLTGYGSGPMSNAGFVRAFIEPRGRLGRIFWTSSRYINTGKYSIKMGDTPSLLWAITSTTLNPARPSLGGRFRRVGKTRKWVDVPLDKERLGQYDGARTVAIHRRAILLLWRRQLNFIYGEL